MAKSDSLNQYAEGWIKGDAAIIMGSLDDSYQLDDPNAGKITKQAFTAYFSDLTQQLQSMGGGTAGNFLGVSDLVTQEEGGLLTAWVWWVFPGTSIEGSGLIKVGDSGVLSERLTFYTKLRRVSLSVATYNPLR